MKGNTAVSRSNRLCDMLRERNGVIREYKERCEGLNETVMMLKALLTFAFSEGECVINKQELSDRINDPLMHIRVTDGGDCYHVSVGIDTSDLSENEENEI